MTWPERHEPTTSDFDAAFEGRWVVRTARSDILDEAERALMQRALRDMAARPIMLPLDVTLEMLEPYVGPRE